LTGLAKSRRTGPARGFTLIEMVFVAAVMLVFLAFSILNLASAWKSFEAQSDARGIANQLSLARLRAAAEFTQARLNFNLAAGTYKLETNQLGVWTREGSVYNLSAANAFSFGSVTSPAGTQTAPIAQTALIVFNSRGIPVDATTGTPTGNDAIYLRNTNGQYYAVTVSPSSRINVWQLNGSTWKQF